MGIDLFSAKFFASEVRKGVSLGQMLTLGHQSICMDDGAYKTFISALGRPGTHQEYADELFSALGATSIDVMDVSNYEGANVLHDLNQPVNAALHGRYDCVFDGGALEHVFNLPTALKNCLEMVKVGGHFITIAPTNNYCGHGFYQFSPELFYSALSPANGFSVERLLFVHQDRWYSVRRPEDVRERIGLLTKRPTLLFVSAKRCEQKPIFEQWPQQSDYVQTWNAGQTEVKPAQPAKRALTETLTRVAPFLKRPQSLWREIKFRRRCSPGNSDWFTPVDIDIDLDPSGR